MAIYDIVMWGYSPDLNSIGAAFGPVKRRISGVDAFCELVEQLVALHDNYIGDDDPAVEFGIEDVHYRLTIHLGTIMISDVDNPNRHNISLDLQGFRQFVSARQDTEQDIADDEVENKEKSQSKRPFIFILIAALAATAIIQGGLFFLNQFDDYRLDYDPITDKKEIKIHQDEICGVYSTGDELDSEIVAISPSGLVHFYLRVGDDKDVASSYEWMESVPYEFGISKGDLILAVENWGIAILDKGHSIIWIDFVFHKADLDPTIQQILLSGPKLPSEEEER